MPAEKWVAILQSNYIPWKGYFDLINRVDDFIFYDTAQYTTNDWRNRNRIKTAGGLHWLTIPIRTAGHLDTPIEAMRASDMRWAKKHWRSLQQSYARAPHFRTYAAQIQALYENLPSDYLSEINAHFIRGIAQLLGITTRLSWSREYVLEGGQTERLVNLCRQANATHYLSGPAARDYLDERLFTEAGITLVYMDYSGYAPYPQLFGDFAHSVTVLDVLFNTGPDARRYMLSWG